MRYDQRTLFTQGLVATLVIEVPMCIEHIVDRTIGDTCDCRLYLLSQTPEIFSKRFFSRFLMTVPAAKT